MKKNGTSLNSYLIIGSFAALIGCGQVEHRESELNSIEHPRPANAAALEPDASYDLEACSWHTPGDCIRDPIDAVVSTVKDAQAALATAFEKVGLDLDVRESLENEAFKIARAQGNPNRAVCRAAVVAGITAYAANKGLVAGPWGSAVAAFLGAGGGLLIADAACSKAYP